jgi:hypothetical protein
VLVCLDEALWIVCIGATESVTMVISRGVSYVGLARTIYIYIYIYIYGIYIRYIYTVYIYGIYIYTVYIYGIYIYIYTVHIRYFWQGNRQIHGQYGVYIRFWPTLVVRLVRRI